MTTECKFCHGAKVVEIQYGRRDESTFKRKVTIRCACTYAGPKLDPNEVIDVWEVEPHKDPQFDIYCTDDASHLHKYVGEVAEQLLDNLVEETVTITIRHREMTRGEFERSGNVEASGEKRESRKG